MSNSLFLSTNPLPRPRTLSMLEEESQEASVNRMNIEIFVKDRKYKLITTILMFIDSASLAYYKSSTERMYDNKLVVLLIPIIYVLFSTLSFIYLAICYRIVLAGNRLARIHIENYFTICTVMKSFQICLFMKPLFYITSGFMTGYFHTFLFSNILASYSLYYLILGIFFLFNWKNHLALKILYIAFSVIIIITATVMLETMLCDGKNEEKVISILLTFYVIGYSVSGTDRSSLILYNNVMIYFIPAKIVVIVISILLMLIILVIEITVWPIYKLCKSRFSVAPVTDTE